MLMNSVLTVGSNVPLAVSYPFGMSKERLIVKRRYCYPQMPKSCSCGCPRSCPIKTKKGELSPSCPRQKRFGWVRLSQNRTKRKTPETVEFPGFLGILKSRSALGELRSATGCFETVLNISMVRFSLILRAFSHFLLSVVLFLNHRNR